MATKRYIKKFIVGDDRKGGTRSLETVKNWIDEGKPVFLFFSEDHRNSYQVLHPVTGISEKDGKILVETEGGTVVAEGFDDNIRTITSSCVFVNKTRGTSLTLEEAKEALANGDLVKADCIRFVTSQIVSFWADDLFETASGSLYKLIP